MPLVEKQPTSVGLAAPGLPILLLLVASFPWDAVLIRDYQQHRGKNASKMQTDRSHWIWQENYLRLLVFIGIGLFFPFAAFAADIRPLISGTGGLRQIVIEGEIERGDYETFVQIVRENNGQISSAYCFSPGGNFNEAIKIGRAMRALELHSQAPMRNADGRPQCDLHLTVTKPKDPKNCTCASAGFFIHIGGISRGGTYLAVHRPYFEKAAFGNLSESDAKKAFDGLQGAARVYMKEMGLPQHIQEDVLGTPSDKILVLDEKTVRTHIWGQMPHRHEWVQGRCSNMTVQERAQYQELSNVIRKRGANISDKQMAQLSALMKKNDAERDCHIAVSQRSRLAAYEKFFQQKPNDLGNHDFSRWADASRYLGMNYYQITSEERFEESTFLGSVSLKREASASAPAILLNNSASRPRMVGAVAVFSSPDPSLEFIGRVVEILTKSWGNPTAGDGPEKWHWNNGEFRADLEHMPKAAEGRYLVLKLEPTK